VRQKEQLFEPETLCYSCCSTAPASSKKWVAHFIPRTITAKAAVHNPTLLASQRGREDSKDSSNRSDNEQRWGVVGHQQIHDERIWHAQREVA